MPRSSRRSGGSVLIAAISGRALARAAVDAGLRPLVADFFADTDTQAIAHACRKLPGDIGRGMQWPAVARALQALTKAAPSPLLGVVYGSGFEDRPKFLARIAKRWPLLGNDAATVARIKSPESFFGTLDRLGIAYPPTMTARPVNGAGWVAKRRGGAGGSHVVPSRLQRDAVNAYYQALVEGRAVSALFLANGRRSVVLGFSEQWTAPAPRRLWRYGGAVRPASLPESTEAAMARAVALATRAFGIKGLASADFVLKGNEALLLEVNPRPGATLDVFAGAAKPLLDLHLDAVLDGKLPRTGLKLKGAAAAAIVYAPRSVIVPRNMTWPDWAADIPKPGERIDKQRPICTVLARAGTKGRAKRLVETRKSIVLAKIQKAEQGKHRGQKDKREPNTPNGTPERQRQGGTARPRPHR
ncbi:MAG: ATP-grasp domain-containing protein [Methyloceanibacter sp.]|uniref:ATP-grasp domain-containing protein n=1 Tax=Methyloceanibacter sp. TaxID=1965321 RepID=UPI003D6D91DD